MLTFASVPLPISFFAKKELFFIPLFGWAMITSGMIPVNRNNKNKSKKSVDKAIDKIGIDRRLYTSGENKAILDPFLPENKDDVKRLKAIQKELHNQFISFVKSRRGSKISSKDKDLFTGAFWSGEKSLDLGLIDAFGEMKLTLKVKLQ